VTCELEDRLATVRPQVRRCAGWWAFCARSLSGTATGRKYRRSGQLQRIEFNERWEEIRREPLLRELKQRIRDVRGDPTGCCMC
jgi:hypothetical protein